MDMRDGMTWTVDSAMRWAMVNSMLCVKLSMTVRTRWTFLRVKLVLEITIPLLWIFGPWDPVTSEPWDHEPIEFIYMYMKRFQCPSNQKSFIGMGGGWWWHYKYSYKLHVQEIQDRP